MGVGAINVQANLPRAGKVLMLICVNEILSERSSLSRHSYFWEIHHIEHSKKEEPPCPLAIW